MHHWAALVLLAEMLGRQSMHARIDLGRGRLFFVAAEGDNFAGTFHDGCISNTPDRKTQKSPFCAAPPASLINQGLRFDEGGLAAVLFVVLSVVLDASNARTRPCPSFSKRLWLLVKSTSPTSPASVVPSARVMCTLPVTIAMSRGLSYTPRSPCTISVLVIIVTCPRAVILVSWLLPPDPSANSAVRTSPSTCLLGSSAMAWPRATAIFLS